MKIIKRPSEDIKIEQAHGGSGSRKVFVAAEHIKNDKFEAMTYGYLPGGSAFDWHDHKDTEEVMVVVKGSGKVCDEDGKYSYSAGDVFIFPSNTQHKIVNDSKEQHELIFVRIKL